MKFWPAHFFPGNRQCGSPANADRRYWGQPTAPQTASPPASQPCDDTARPGPGDRRSPPTTSLAAHTPTQQRTTPTTKPPSSTLRPPAQPRTARTTRRLSSTPPPDRFGRRRGLRSHRRLPATPQRPRPGGPTARRRAAGLPTPIHGADTPTATGAEPSFSWIDEMHCRGLLFASGDTWRV